MYLTKNDIAQLPASAFTGINALINAISSKYSVGISNETAARILADFATTK